MVYHFRTTLIVGAFFILLIFTGCSSSGKNSPQNRPSVEKKIVPTQQQTRATIEIKPSAETN